MSDAIVVQKVFNAPLNKVWKAITDKNEMKKWYFDIKEFEPVPGFEFTFVAGDENGKITHFCKIRDVEEQSRLSYTWAYEGIPVETVVTFELSPEGDNKTRVKLSHKGVGKFPQEATYLAKENFIEGWNYIIGTSLLNYLEGTESKN